MRKKVRILTFTFILYLIFGRNDHIIIAYTNIAGVILTVRGTFFTRVTFLLLYYLPGFPNFRFHRKIRPSFSEPRGFRFRVFCVVDSHSFLVVVSLQ